MRICTVSHYRIDEVGSDGTDSVHVYEDLPTLEATLAYARIMTKNRRMVQAIKFVRSNLGLQLREAHAICVAMRDEFKGGEE